MQRLEELYSWFHVLYPALVVIIVIFSLAAVGDAARKALSRMRIKL